MIQWFDSHAHLMSKPFAQDIDAVLDRAREAGVTRILNLGTTLETSRQVVEIAHRHAGCLAAVGVHPGDLECWSDAEAQGLMELARDPAVVVYGEIGLDYYWKKHDHDFQKQVFRRQLAMARELKLPVSMHCREAYDDLVAILEEENAAEIGGVAHCFLGTKAHANRLTAMGFYLGVGGIATYPKSDDVRAVLREVSVEWLLLETDAPYLPPQPKRGKRNEPAFVAMTGEYVAEMLGMEAEEFAAITWRNTERAFRL